MSKPKRSRLVDVANMHKFNQILNGHVGGDLFLLVYHLIQASIILLADPKWHTSLIYLLKKIKKKSVNIWSNFLAVYEDGIVITLHVHIVKISHCQKHLPKTCQHIQSYPFLSLWWIILTVQYSGQPYTRKIVIIWYEQTLDIKKGLVQSSTF